MDGQDATRGGYGVLTFRVPTESATASTTEVTVTLPADHPIASVSVQPVAGWTATVTSAKLAEPIATDDGQVTTYASRIDWKADTAAAIKPGEFQQFSVSAGPLPDVASLALPTTQRYTDGTVVEWNQLATGAAEPVHPAPVLTIAAATTAHATPSDFEAAEIGSDSGSAALAVAIAAVVAALAAVIVAIIALLRGSRRGEA